MLDFQFSDRTDVRGLQLALRTKCRDSVGVAVGQPGSRAQFFVFGW